MTLPVTKDPKLEKKFDANEEAKIEDWQVVPLKDFDKSPKIESPKTEQKFHPTEVSKMFEESKVFPYKDFDKTLQIECSKIEEKFLCPTEESKMEKDSKVFKQNMKDDFLNEAVTKRYV